MGPTLEAAGAGMIVPLITYTNDKNNPIKTSLTNIYYLERNLPNVSRELILQLKKTFIEHVADNPLPIIESNEEDFSTIFANLSLAITFILILCWVLSMYLSVKLPNSLLLSFPYSFYPGFIAYIIGLILTEVKESI
jgi:hypothetical protein